MTTPDQRARTVRVEAPADLDPLVVAQAVVGPHILLKAEDRPRARKRPFARHKALQTLFEHVGERYDINAKKLVAAIRRYLKTERLLKAKGPKQVPLVTPAQLDEIVRIIRDHHLGFNLEMGFTTADKAEIDRLVGLGILPDVTRDIMGDSFKYGVLVATTKRLDEPTRLREYDYGEFKRDAEKEPYKLPSPHQRAVEFARHSAAFHVTSLGTRISDDFQRVALDADAELRRQYRSEIREAVEHGTEERKTWREVASDIGHKTEDWGRDLRRIAATEMQSAHQEGYAEGLIDTYGDPDSTLVAKRPAPDACPDCVRLHLTAGQGSAPKIFKLSELLDNGTNVGRKRPEWLPVTGTVHPWCQCQLIHVPPGMGFETKPPEGKGWERVPGSPKPGAYRRNRGSEEEPEWQFWSPRMVPDTARKGLQLHRDLMKSIATFQGDMAGDAKGIEVQVSDPLVLQAVNRVIAKTPVQLFDRDVGITIITTDIPRPGVALKRHDLAYWTGNEIRLSQELPADDVERVLMHEMGHTLNVYLIRTMGGEPAVRDWHDRLYRIANEEGHVSQYASTLPIECAAEVTRLYLYERRRLMRDFPRQFTFVHQAYRPLRLGRLKKAGPYIGPRGGKWADAKHTIPWDKPVKRALFHAAPANVMHKIKDEGLTARAGGSLYQQGHYQEHSAGKVHLADNPQAGRHWHENTERQLEAQHDDPKDHNAVMLRVKHRRTALDPVGDKDVPGSRFTRKDIDPGDLEYHDKEHGWRPVEHWEPGRHSLPSDEEALHPGREAHRRLTARKKADAERAESRKRSQSQADKWRAEAEALDKEWRAKPAAEREAKAKELAAKRSPIPGMTQLKPDWQKRLGVDAKGNLLKAFYKKRVLLNSGLTKAAHKLHRRRKWNGLDISVETQTGAYRYWTDSDGSTGRTLMRYDYGYVKGSLGTDGDHVDVYVGPHEDAPNVYVLNQRRGGDFSKFDEQKCMLGFRSLEAARRAYLIHYDDDRFLGSIKAMPTSEFCRKVMRTRETKSHMIKGKRLTQIFIDEPVHGID